jgi:mannose-6-phosphate isomerase
MSDIPLGPQLLPPNQIEHFYRGGDRITALRGGSGALYRPEEWIASVTTMAGQTALGLSRLSDGTLLRDAIAADPKGWLGPAHVAAYGASTELLVKLLDAGERLPVHVHPDRAFARQHLGLAHGKTEAWIVLEADEGARVRLGFAESMRPADVRAMADAQDTEAMVGALLSRPVRPGDGVLVPAGLPHCIDAGLLVLELQEPTDLSILLEWAGFAIDGPQQGHLGLGFDLAYQALRYDALDAAELDRLVAAGQAKPAGDRSKEAGDRPEGAGDRPVRAGDQPVGAGDRPEGADLASLLPAAADPFFRAHQLRSEQASPAVEPGFSVVLVTGGTGHLVSGTDRLEVWRGNAVVVPWQAGEWHLAGEIDAVVCRPPLPPARAAKAGNARDAKAGSARAGRSGNARDATRRDAGEATAPRQEPAG